jgi:quinohemoprotein ethanol dehydrogenase
MLMTADNWKGVVIDGASATRGMASFARFLNAKDAEDIRAFVIDEAKKAEAGGQAAAVPIG